MASLLRQLAMALLLSVTALMGTSSVFDVKAEVAITDINPNQSTLDPMDPDGASGGRVNGVASVPGDPNTYYAASEWGGLYKTVDFLNAGGRWFRLESHLPMVTWDVEVNPADTKRVYATSFFDGRVDSLAGINVSTDAGTTWVKPATATPPATGFCSNARRSQPSAFGISVDLDAPNNVYVGTNCGLAISNDSGTSWKFVDPTPNDPASNIWDVVVHHGGVIDVCGDDGHARSSDGGITWTPGNLLPSGRCSIAASPHEKDVLFAAVGTNAYETDDAGGTWTNLGTPDSRRQGRIPFVETNPRNSTQFDLWYGDVRLFRGACTSGAAAGGGLRCPMGTVGAIPVPPPPTPAGWAGPFTRSVGGHDDVAAILFDPTAKIDACPVLFSSDGGVYFNTSRSSPSCHTPAWEHPRVTPHAMWFWGFSGVNKPGLDNFDLYAGAQDVGSFATTNAGAASPSWVNRDCCDSFDHSASDNQILYTFCCSSGPPPGVRATTLRRRGPGMAGGGAIPSTSYPTDGLLPGFKFPDTIDRFGATAYVVLTTDCTAGSNGCSGTNGGDGGIYITNNTTVDPIVWTELGNATEPPSNASCAVKAGMSGGVPTFYVQVGDCNGRTADQLWKFVGVNPAGAWQRIDTNLPAGGGVGVFDVDPNNSNRLYVSNLSPTGVRMMFSKDGGVTWQNDLQLDNLMTADGVFLYQNTLGPTRFTGFNGYPQPTFVEFDPQDANVIAAGGADSGVFLTIDGGFSWTRLSDPFDPVGSGIPHIPRPRFAVFDNEPGDRIDIYVGTQGKGALRIGFKPPKPKFEYAAKIVCGPQTDNKSMRLARGFYATTINIHSPGKRKNRLFKKLALSYPPERQAPGDMLAIGHDALGYDQALKTDCDEIRRKLFPGGFPQSYIEGFVVIQSTDPLDVTAVYTTADVSEDGTAVRHSSIDVERISARHIGVDLAVEKTVTVFPFRITDNFTIFALLYKVVIENKGAQLATAITASDQLLGQASNAVAAVVVLATPIDLPPGGQIKNIASTPPSASFELELGDLDAGSALTVRFWALVPVYVIGNPPNVFVRNTISVASAEAENTPLDNTTTIETQLIP
jgi:photosystem II stability/assembly factor-like uncharacterized protein